MDSQQLQQATSNPNIQRVLQKQASLQKRMSTAGQASDHQVSALAVSGHPHVVGGGPQSAAAAAGGPPATTRIKIPETSYSHTETAV